MDSTGTLSDKNALDDCTVYTRHRLADPFRLWCLTRSLESGWKTRETARSNGLPA